MVEPPFIGAIALPDGTVIRGRGCRQPLPAGRLPDFGLYLGRPPDQQRRSLFRHREPWQPDWSADWIDWPDFRTPRDDRLAADLIEHAYLLARAGHCVEVACGGGTGRTGTVIACMAILAGHPAADALAWTRRHYRPRAVETPGQRRWIGWFATHTRAR
ncbi:MAG: protein-tyrosine phosphatase family protein [Pseudonocardiaceae bacterium]